MLSYSSAIDKYVYVIVALLPISSLMLVFQSNPYQALIVRAILGSVAALVYATLGGADVALTEALVGTMLATMLYIVAVRSSLVMRLGIVEGKEIEDSYFSELTTSLKQAIAQYHLRLEIIDYANPQALQAALMSQEVHAICTKQVLVNDGLETDLTPIFQTKIRINRLFEILQREPILHQTTLEYITVLQAEEKH